MPHTCSKCSRVNPADAVYCYFDGSYLQQAQVNGGGVAALAVAAGEGPIQMGSQPFANNFVFPSGLVCQSFDQLAMGCQQNWSAAADLLAKGYFETFLAGLGRADLGQAARRAAKFPDRDRGLDQMLGELPTDVLKPPKLQVEPLEVNLGTLKAGEDKQLELQPEQRGYAPALRLGHLREQPLAVAGQVAGLTAEAVPVRHRPDHPGQYRRQATPGRQQAARRPAGHRIQRRHRPSSPFAAEVPVKPFPDGRPGRGDQPAAGRREGQGRSQGGGRPVREGGRRRTGTRTTAGPTRSRGRRPRAWARCSSSSRRSA